VKVLLAPDSFKGSLSAGAAAEAMALGIQRIRTEQGSAERIEVELLPVADGGEGTLECLLAAMNGKLVTLPVHDPLGRLIDASYGLLPDGTAIIEMAAAAGLTLVDELEQDILQANTFGVGELVLHALDHGSTSFVIGIGGSATNDAGVGLLSALGMRMFSQTGRELPPTPEALLEVHSVDFSDLHPDLEQATIRVACDVTNPLCGSNGASVVFGPQKGASPEEVELLERALERFADVAEARLGHSFRNVPGVGAAGGLGGALHGVLQGELVKGIDLVLDVLEFDKRVATVDLVLTGEGKTDGQTSQGKVVVGIAERAARSRVPVFCLAGSVTKEAEELYGRGVDALFGLPRGPISLQESIEQAADLLALTAETAVRAFSAGLKRGGVRSGTSETDGISGTSEIDRTGGTS